LSHLGQVRGLVEDASFRGMTPDSGGHIKDVVGNPTDPTSWRTKVIGKARSKSSGSLGTEGGESSGRTPLFGGGAEKIQGFERMSLKTSLCGDLGRTGGQNTDSLLGDMAHFLAFTTLGYITGIKTCYSSRVFEIYRDLGNDIPLLHRGSCLL